MPTKRTSHWEGRPVMSDTNTESSSEVSGTSAGAGTSLADTAAAYRSSGAEVMSDIGQAEAYTVNLKRLVADELDHDQFVRANRERLIRNGEDTDQQHRDQATRAIEESLQLQKQLNEQYLSYIAGLNATAISERERTVRHGDIAANNMWQGDVTMDSIVEAAVVKALNKVGIKSA